MMFTKEQGQELIDNANQVWTTINGTNGRKFINKTDDSKWIFLQVGGWWYDTTYEKAGSYGHYWSTKWESIPIARHLRLAPTYTSIDKSNCASGFPNRPIAPPRPW